MHPDEKTKNIALGRLKSMLKASGFEVKSFSSEDELLKAVYECRCLLRVSVREDQNVINGYESERAITQGKEAPSNTPF